MEDIPSKLRGMFAAIVYDRATESYVAFRDHVGIIPLYIGYGSDGSVWFSSEMKALANDCTRFEQFLPGHIYSSKTREFTRYYNPNWLGPQLPTKLYDKLLLRSAFESAVRSHIMSDVPWGVLLSGGLDSSLVASVAARIMRGTASVHGHEDHRNWFPKLHSFCIGLENSPDLLAAAKVAKFIGTVHHTYTFTIQEGLDALSEVIYHLETFDTTTIRASTPMFLMSRKIKAMGIKMVLSGEGSDEIFGGYLYFHKAPNPKEFQDELRDKISNLYLFDCLRANKATSAWGVEARVPFLDQDFLDVAMQINAEEKMIGPGRIEKFILRDAFDDQDDPYLPQDILWRQKEQFSDGVGYGWIDSLRALAEERVTDQMFSNAKNRFPQSTPLTKEAYLYRSIFETHYPQPASVATVPYGPSIACSTARAIEWDASFKDRADCSGRAVASVHEKAYDSSFVAVSTATEEATGDAPSKRQKLM